MFQGMQVVSYDPYSGLGKVDTERWRKNAGLCQISFPRILQIDVPCFQGLHGTMAAKTA